MGLFKEGKVSSLVREYEEAAKLRSNLMANKQVKVIRSLCEIGTKEAFSQVEKLMVEGDNHEYMDFAFPDILMEYMEISKFQIYSIQALITGALRGRSEALQKACLRKLVDIQYAPIYQTLVEYRNHLLADVANQPASIIDSVIEALVELNSCVDAKNRISPNILRLNQPIYIDRA